LHNRGELVGCARAAVEERRGFAAGKIGYSEQRLLRHPLLDSRTRHPLQSRELAESYRPALSGVQCHGWYW